MLVSKRPDLVEKVLALELGAADIVASPISGRELAARISAAGRPPRQGRRELVVLENATVDLKAALVMHRVGERGDSCRPARSRCSGSSSPIRARC